MIKMRISLIIPAYNEEKTIPFCLASVFSQKLLPDEIIVVNDGSTDSTDEMVRMSFDYYEKKKTKAILIDRKKNLGKTESIKEGIENSTGDIIILTDADSILNLDMAENIIKPFSDPEVGAATGYVKSQRGTGIMAARQIEYLISLGIHKSGQDVINGLFVIAGCCAAFRREAIEKVGFEGDTLTEDLDLTWRFVKAGYKVVYAPKAVAKTQDPPDIKSLWRQLRRWYTGTAQCLKKHKDIFGKTRLGRITIPLMLFDAIITSVIYFIVLFIAIVDLILFNNLSGFIWLSAFYLFDLMFGAVFAFYGMFKLGRADLFKALPTYLALLTINRVAWIYSLSKEFLFPAKTRRWGRAKRLETAR